MTQTGLEVHPAEPGPPGERTGPRVGALLFALIAAGLVAAGIAAASEAMRWVMVNQGGSCASGGPYQVNPGQECSGAAVGLLFGGIIGGLIAAGLVVVAAKRAAGWNALMAASGLMWAGLFGAFGWNFIDLGLNPPEGQGGTTGWIISGVVFWLMAFPGLLGILGLRRGRPATAPRAAAAIPIVRARIPGAAAPAAGQPPAGMQEPPAAPSGWPWLAVTAVGAVAGAIAGAQLASSIL